MNRASAKQKDSGETKDGCSTLVLKWIGWDGYHWVVGGIEHCVNSQKLACLKFCGATWSYIDNDIYVKENGEYGNGAI